MTGRLNHCAQVGQTRTVSGGGIMSADNDRPHLVDSAQLKEMTMKAFIRSSIL
jgi:hypothetical protein